MSKYLVWFLHCHYQHHFGRPKGISLIRVPILSIHFLAISVL